MRSGLLPFHAREQARLERSCVRRGVRSNSANPPPTADPRTARCIGAERFSPRGAGPAIGELCDHTRMGRSADGSERYVARAALVFDTRLGIG